MFLKKASVYMFCKFFILYSLLFLFCLLYNRCADEPPDAAAGSENPHLWLQLSEETGAGLPLHAGESHHWSKAGGESSAYELTDTSAWPQLISRVCLWLQICQVIGEVSSANQELLRKYKREMNLRKKCHNELVRLKGETAEISGNCVVWFMLCSLILWN